MTGTSDQDDGAMETVEEGAVHGIMGTGIPAGGLLRYRK